MQDNIHKILSELAGFVGNLTKTFWCFCFQFTVPVAIHLQNTNAEFHTVVH